MILLLITPLLWAVDRLIHSRRLAAKYRAENGPDWGVK